MSNQRTARYPSQEFPAPPTISIDVPEEWEPVKVAGPALAVAMPAVEGQFRANVVAVVMREAGEFPLDAAVAALRSKYDASPESEVVRDTEVEISGVRAFHRDITFAQDVVGTLAQAVSLVAVTRDGWTDVVEITATCSGAQAEELFPLLRAMTTECEVVYE